MGHLTEQEKFEAKVNGFVELIDEWTSKQGTQVKMRYSKNRHLNRMSFHKYLDDHSEVTKDALGKVMMQDSASIIGTRMIKERRENMSNSSDSFEKLMEVALASQVLVKADAQLLISDLVSEYNLSSMEITNRKKSFKDITSEIDMSGHKQILDTFKGKAIVAGLFMKMRSKLKAAKSDEERFKVLADMITVSTVFNHNTVKDIFKKIKAGTA